MPLPLKELAKLNQIVQRIQAGEFDANDVDNLLIKLRAFGGGKKIFLELSHFVAHNDARDRGLAQQSITAFVDSIQFFREYIGEKPRPLELDKTFPAYIYRLFLSQTWLADESVLRANYKMSRASLIKKIEGSFVIDKKLGTCSIRPNKIGVELLAALNFLVGYIYSKPAFHVRDFHRELKEVMRAQQVPFEDAAWDAQADRISLALLCLVSNTDFVVPNGGKAGCTLSTMNEFRVLEGQHQLENGETTSEPASFGQLMVRGEATVLSSNEPPLQISFPLIETDLMPELHCDPQLFERRELSTVAGPCTVEIVKLARDMSLSPEFKLIRADSAIT